jgi:hypothetical protein
MKITKFKKNLLFLLLITSQIITGNAYSDELNEDTYVEQKNKNGIVLVAANWGRQWDCGKFENAQLEQLKFEHNDATINPDLENSQINLESPSRLFVDNKFVDYGFIVTPGEYYLTEFSIKVAKSSSDVGYHTADKNLLVKNGKAEGGTFKVNAGETIYIGHFFLDCYYEPIPWRFYPEGNNEFREYKTHIKEQFHYIDETAIEFRLFKTKLFGHDYKL